MAMQQDSKFLSNDMTDTEQITLGYISQYNSLLNDSDFVLDFITKREQSGLDLGKDIISDYDDYNRLLVAISILDGEAVRMLKVVGGLQ